MHIYHKTVSFTNKVLDIIYNRAISLSNGKKIKLSFKYSEFHVNYFTIFSLLTTLSTDVKKSLQCKSIFLSNVT